MKSSLRIAQFRLRESMQARGWNGKELAARAKMTPPQFSRILTGKTSPGLDVLDRLSKALSVPTWSLLQSPQGESSGDSPQAPIAFPKGREGKLARLVLEWLRSEPSEAQLKIILGAIRGMISSRSSLQSQLQRLKVPKNA